MATTDQKNGGGGLVPERESSGASTFTPTCFTISPREKTCLDTLSSEMNISRSAIVRIAIRRLKAASDRASDAGVLAYETGVLA